MAGELLNGVLIGFGNMGQLHARCYAALGASVVVVDPNPCQREVASAQGLKCYQALSDFSFGAASFFDLCTPTDLHYQQIRALSECSRPMFVEKPIVRTSRQAQSLHDRPPQCQLFVGEVELYNASLAAFVLDAERPVSITIERQVNLGFFLGGEQPWFLDEQRSGGIVLDCMIHDIHLLLVKYGAAMVRHGSGRSRRFSLVDEVEATLDFGDFRAELITHWTRRDEQSPVRTRIAWRDQAGRRHRLEASDYGLLQEDASSNPFQVELAAFLEMVQGKRPADSLVPYLQAVCIAEEIREAITGSGSRCG